MKKVFISVIVSCMLLLVLANCERSRNNPLDPKAVNYKEPTPFFFAWETIFSDSFNRGTTANSNVGPGWLAILAGTNITPNSIVKVTNNEAFAQESGKAVYDVEEFNDLILRISAKFRTSSGVPTEVGLFGRYNTGNGDGYWGGISTNNKLVLFQSMNGTNHIFGSSDVALTANSTYYLEFILAYPEFVLYLYNSAQIQIGTISTIFTNTPLTTGKVGFYGGCINNSGPSYAVYLDDFLLDRLR